MKIQTGLSIHYDGQQVDKHVYNQTLIKTLKEISLHIINTIW